MHLTGEKVELGLTNGLHSAESLGYPRHGQSSPRRDDALFGKT